MHYSHFLSCTWQSLLVRLGVACGVQFLDFRGDPGVARPQCLVRQWLHVLRLRSLVFIGGITHIFSTWTRIVVFFLRSHAEWRIMLSRCFNLSPGTRCLPLKSGQYSNEEPA